MADGVPTARNKIRVVCGHDQGIGDQRQRCGTGVARGIRILDSAKGANRGELATGSSIQPKPLLGSPTARRCRWIDTGDARRR